MARLRRYSHAESLSVAGSLRRDVGGVVFCQMGRQLACWRLSPSSDNVFAIVCEQAGVYENALDDITANDNPQVMLPLSCCPCLFQMRP